MSRFTIGKQLGLGVAALGALLFVLSLTSLHAVGKLGQSLNAALTNTARRIELVDPRSWRFRD